MRRSAGKVRPSVLRYRRHPDLVLYWADDELVVHNYRSDTRVVVDPAVAVLLHGLREWRGASEISSTLPPDGRPGLSRTLERLVRHGLLERSDRRVEALWRAWGPAAAFLHFSTKRDLAADGDLEAAQIDQRARVGGAPAPAFVKRLPRSPSVALNTPRLDGELARILEARRTWRRFGRRAVSRRALSTLLWWTFGIHGWSAIDGAPPTPRRTSPSAGARQVLEAYVLVRRVSGLAPGLYHYAADDHRLEAQRTMTAPVDRYLPRQWWFADAPVVVFMAAVFPRVQWRYPYARAYRSVLLEAGHFCQTFCLVATALGLAPFSTQATADEAVERDFGLDGVHESIVYAAGVGPRPADGVCRWPDHEEGHPYRAPKTEGRRPKTED